MFTFCWILLLFIKGAEVREFNLTGCLHKEPERIYHAITDEEFILECVLPSQHHTHMYNNSFLYKSNVLWFWQQKDGEPLKIISSKSTNPAQEGNALWFRPIGINASGVYICMIREEIPCLSNVIKVQAKNNTNCSDNGRNELSLLIEEGHSISCPGIHCYNHLQRSPVTWYKNGIRVMFKENRSSLKLKDDTIYLRRTYEQDAGIYVCDYILFDNSIQWTMRRVVRVKIIARNTLHSPNILSPSGMKTLEVEIGKPLKIECKVFFGFESNFLPMITWYRDNKESKSEPLLQKPTRIRVEELEGKSFVHVATLREVTERDLNSNLICFAQNSVGNSTGVLKLKRKERALFIFILYGAIAVLVGLLLGSAFVYQHWIEIVLMYRNYLAKDETIGDRKEFDAFVSYAKQDSFERDSTFLNEEQFALEVLPEVLENKYGYKLCLLERDILPGGAYTDDIVTAIQQSRRAIIILSPGYVNGPSIFELQAAVNCALEDNMLKLILIKYKSFHEPESLPPIVKKALKILPVVTWKSSNSNSPNKQFWKYMRYHMPVKNTRGLGKNSLKFFFHRLFSMVINSRKATGRSQQTKK
ncbi:interleukin-18 receptor accessory protein isoform X1 [Mauremys reevesii]|uniref:interleukin-18 receptor accessory protein isoform X1 n=2 Tax=Mauremys reevesii TaxID=260615 RepID=UPI0019400161|nr:interleukin-18 receptor accessory protein isoform X1 [Mauremys reevesii]XP_039375677.1 interleukin-18 receptor accessory protein isoform X1 [Mauremys reevesii]XP_039375678.1 interleukin-18 receptor accessory protein isoform X1 [Mauremys reevesii]XP_039375679.1 interleukin-18 receptor accessory protein isoform X1 [Mauremys reevesii]XP_039375680.1 interleukin-18 receptor accessory protein isoform X1 [Mauremys reevesii]XP_039375681.1 interleukin-18 receptor accessory protein isoform X1 [Maurem